MIKVLLAEDMHMVRSALVALLVREPDISVVAEVDTGTGILPAAIESRPDVAVIDVDLPGKDGLSAAAEIHEKLPTCRTLILTSMGLPGTLRRALVAKVNGFIFKDAPAAKLANSIREVSVGRRVIDADLALAAWETEECRLTGRELEVLRMTESGADAVEIAIRLFLSAGTVRNYLTTIVTKLNARTRVDAIRIAKGAGWL